jgi:hypothetical protein
VTAIQQSLPILQETATDYRKYIKDDGDEMELIMKASRDKAAFKKADKQLNDAMHFSGGVALSVCYCGGLLLSMMIVRNISQAFSVCLS